MDVKHWELRGVYVDTVQKPRGTISRDCGAGRLRIQGHCYYTSDYINNSLNKTTCDHILFPISLLCRQHTGSCNTCLLGRLYIKQK